jgi:hypothetical protein
LISRLADQLSNAHLSKPNQLLQISFVTLLEPLQRSYHNLVIILWVTPFSSTIYYFSQPPHPPLSRCPPYSFIVFLNDDQKLRCEAVGVLTSFTALVSFRTRHSSPFLKLLAAPRHFPAFIGL